MLHSIYIVPFAFTNNLGILGDKVRTTELLWASLAAKIQDEWISNHIFEPVWCSVENNLLHTLRYMNFYTHSILHTYYLLHVYFNCNNVYKHIYMPVCKYLLMHVCINS